MSLSPCATEFCSVPTSSGPKEVGRFRSSFIARPNGKHFAQKEYTIFRRAVQRGYAVVIQDVRGRYASDGEFRPYENEGRDGFDTIEWAAQRRWSSGDVGTFGLCYPGAVQWLAAVALESPLSNRHQHFRRKQSAPDTKSHRM